MPRTKQQRPRHILGSLLDTDGGSYKEMATASHLEKYFSSSPSPERHVLSASDRSDTSHDEESVDTTFLPPPPPLRRDESDKTTRMKVLTEKVSPTTVNQLSFAEISTTAMEDESRAQSPSENSEFLCQSSEMNKSSRNHPQTDNDARPNDCYKEKKLFAPFSTLHAFVNDQQRTIDAVKKGASPHSDDDKDMPSQSLLKSQLPYDNKLTNNSEQRNKYYNYLKGIISENIRNQTEKVGSSTADNKANECGERSPHMMDSVDDKAKFNEHLKKLSNDPQLRTVWQSFVLNPIFQQLMAKFLLQNHKEISQDHQEEGELEREEGDGRWKKDENGKNNQSDELDKEISTKSSVPDQASPNTFNIEDAKQRNKSPLKYSQTFPVKTNCNPASTEETVRYHGSIPDNEQRRSRFDEDRFRPSTIPSNFQLKDWRERSFGYSYPALPALPWSNVIPTYGPLDLSKDITGNGDNKPLTNDTVNGSNLKDHFRRKRTNDTNAAKNTATAEVNSFLDSRPLFPVPHHSYLNPGYQRYLFDPPLSPDSRHRPKRSPIVSPITYGTQSPFNIPFNEISGLPTPTYFNPWSAIYPPIPGLLNMPPSQLSTSDRMNSTTVPKCPSGSSVSSTSPSRPSSSHSAPNRSNINGKPSNARSKSQTNNSSMDSIHAAIVRQAKEMNKGMDPENMYIECPICHKRIKRLYHFQRHMRIHSGEKSHECPYCPYKSVRKDNLKSHMKTHEKNKYDSNKRSAVRQTNTERTTNYQARPNYRQRPFDALQDQQALPHPPIISPSNSLSPISSGITSHLLPYGSSHYSQSVTPPYNKTLPADLRQPRFGLPSIYPEIPYFSKPVDDLKTSGLLYGRYPTTPPFLIPPIGIDNGRRMKDYRRSPGSITEITNENEAHSSSEECVRSKSNHLASQGCGSAEDNEISITPRNSKEKIINTEDRKFNIRSSPITDPSSPSANAEVKNPIKSRRRSDEIVKAGSPKRQKLDLALSDDSKLISKEDVCMKEISNSNNSNNLHDSPSRIVSKELPHTQPIFPRFSPATFEPYAFPFFEKITAENIYDNNFCKQQRRPEKKDRETRTVRDPTMPAAPKDFQEGEDKSDADYRSQFSYARFRKNGLLRGDGKTKSNFVSTVGFQPFEDFTTKASNDRANAIDVGTEESSSDDTVFSNQPYQKDLICHDVSGDASTVKKMKASGLPIPRKSYFLPEHVTKNLRIRSAPDLDEETNRSEEPAAVTYEKRSADGLKLQNARSSSISPWRKESNLFRVNADVKPCTNSDHSANPYCPSNIRSLPPFCGELGEEKHDDAGASSSKLIYTGVGDPQHPFISNSTAREFKCRLCEFSGSSASTLQAHMPLHKEDGLYKCQQCDYHGKNLSKLIEHIRIHTGERPFQCDQCSYAAKRKDNLAQHKSVRHDKSKFKGPVKILKLSPSEFLEGPCNEPGHKDDDEPASKFLYNKAYDPGYQPLSDHTMHRSTNLKSSDGWKLNYRPTTIPAFSPIANGLHCSNRLDPEKRARLQKGEDKSMLHMSNMFTPLAGVPHYPFSHFLTYDNLSSKFMPGHPLVTQSIISTLPSLDLHTKNLSDTGVKFASSFADTPPNISSGQKHHARPPNSGSFSKALQQCAR